MLVRPFRRIVQSASAGPYAAVRTYNPQCPREEFVIAYIKSSSELPEGYPPFLSVTFIRAAFCRIRQESGRIRLAANAAANYHLSKLEELEIVFDAWRRLRRRKISRQSTVQSAK